MDSSHAPDFVLTVDGRDITATVDARLISLQLTEGRGDESDALTLTLDDSDGRMDIPPPGATITLMLGWLGETLVDKGAFEVDEIEHSGTPDTLHITARAAEMRGDLRRRAQHSYHETTLGALVQAVAARNRLMARISPALAGLALAHEDQTNESDLHFISRIARLHDATATVKKGTLIVLAIDSKTSASGQPLPEWTMTRADGDQHRWVSAQRDSYSGARATWHDVRTGQQHEVIDGEADNAKNIKDTYTREQDAIWAARSERSRIERGKATFSLTLAMGRADLMAQSIVRLQGFKPKIDEPDWRIVKITHSLGDGGFTSQLEMELAGQAAHGGGES
jgi:phage protein D